MKRMGKFVIKYNISSNKRPRRSLDSKVLRFGAYCRAALKKRGAYFKVRGIILFPNNNK